MNRLLALAGVNGAVAMAAAAASAHGPLASATAGQAAHIHLFHALALGLLAAFPGLRASRLIAALFQAGIAGFCIGLYAASWISLRPGPLIPLGGSLLILGWLALAVSALGTKRP